MSGRFGQSVKYRLFSRFTNWSQYDNLFMPAAYAVGIFIFIGEVLV